jgi:hypothetical protein
MSMKYRCGHYEPEEPPEEGVFDSDIYLEWSTTVGADGDMTECWVCFRDRLEREAASLQ